MKKIIAIVSLTVTLSACASGASTGAMIVPVSERALAAEATPLRQSIAVAQVTGGKETSPLWKSNVSNAAFLEALRQSLAVNGLLAQDQARYRLTAELVELRQPIAGFNMTVRAKVRYRLEPVGGGAPILDKVIETPYQAKMGDSLIAVKRLQLANEGAIRTNIQSLIETLIAEGRTNPALARVSMP